MASTVVRPIGHEDRLSIVEHLDELRSRLVFVAIALAVIFSVCFWQNAQLLKIINHPLDVTTQKRTNEGKGVLGAIKVTQDAVKKLAAANAGLGKQLAAPASKLPPATRAAIGRATSQTLAAAKALPPIPINKPVTLGVGEPFTATLTVAFYFTLLIGMPLLLWQIYGFVLPAFSPTERKVVTPLMAMIPVLFLGGVAFGYFLVIPAATRFLQNFNSDQFNVLVQAKDYYKFITITLIAMGLVFQMPVAVLALTRLGVVSAAFLRKNRRYAILINAVIAAALPGTDPVSMLVELVPLLVLYELSVLVAGWFARNDEETDGDGPFSWWGDDDDETGDDDDDTLAADDDDAVHVHAVDDSGDAPSDPDV